MRALVVDDSKAMRLIIKRILIEIGFEVLEACHGREALDCLRQADSVDVALVDVNMPEMNGFEFLEAMRSQSHYDTIAVMMVTTESDIEMVTKALQLGANEYIMKPFGKEGLQEKLRLIGISTGAQ